MSSTPWVDSSKCLVISLKYKNSKLLYLIEYNEDLY